MDEPRYEQEHQTSTRLAIQCQQLRDQRNSLRREVLSLEIEVSELQTKRLKAIQQMQGLTASYRTLKSKLRNLYDTYRDWKKKKSRLKSRMEFMQSRLLDQIEGEPCEVCGGVLWCEYWPTEANE